MLCRADLRAAAERLIPVRLDDVAAYDSFAESGEAVPCDLFIAVDPPSQAVASAIQAQRTVQAPPRQDHLTDFQRYRSLLSAAGIAEETPRTSVPSAEAHIQSLTEQLAQLHAACEERLQVIREQTSAIDSFQAACEERDALIHEQAREIEMLRATAEERLRNATLAQTRAENLEIQCAQAQSVCEERDALIREQAREMDVLRTASEERLQAMRKIQEESERRGVLLTDMTALAQEQEQELVRLRGARFSAT